MTIGISSGRRGRLLGLVLVALALFACTDDPSTPSFRVQSSVAYAAASGSPAAPTNVSATVTAGPAIDVTWTVAGSNQEDFELERQIRNSDGTYTPWLPIG